MIPAPKEGGQQATPVCDAVAVDGRVLLEVAKGLERQLIEASALIDWFCQRVEAGEVHSYNTYNRFIRFLKVRQG